MKLLRRIAVSLLAAALPLAPVRAADAAQFADVPQTHWAYESVRAATQHGLINGLSAKTFGLGEPLTRAQYCAMLSRLMGWEEVLPDRPTFSDNQDRSAWYYGAVETAYANGALLKLSAACAPNEPLPREEMAAMTVRALGYSNLAGIVQSDCPFSDVSTNRGYIALAYRMGIMGGVSASAQQFSPKTASTREQAASVLLRAYERLHAETARQPLDAMPADAAVFAAPLSDTSGKIPMRPRAPLENVYAAAIEAGAGGAVALRTAPLAVAVMDGKILSETTLTAEALAELLADEATAVYRSARYDSSYLIRPEEDGSQTVAWYETEEDIAGKVELCRLLGVKTVYIE